MFGLIVVRDSEVSMLQQLTEQIRQKVLAGDIGSGVRLPPTRTLARDLGVARNTVVQAYEQLVAEGYLESRTGSGTYVADVAGYRAAPQAAARTDAEDLGDALPRDGVIRFHAGNPDTSQFPVTQWARLLKEACLAAPGSLFEYGPAAGERRLRTAIAQYLYRSKGIVCRPEQVLVVPGAALGVELLVAVLAEGGGAAAVEDPSMDFVQHILRRGGCALLPLPVDRSGVVTDGLPQGRDVRLIYAVPSHQFPTGAVLPIGRRLQLLEYARRAGAYIVEDDYDSEYRYQGGPIQSLRHLDPERVIYLGTFSKILSPALRMGYLIVPDHLRARLTAAMEQANLRTPAIEQIALAAFIEGKLLDRHVYRMRKIYERKRAHMIEALKSAFGERMAVSGGNAGLHVLAAFEDVAFCVEDFEEFRRHGVEADWAEDYAIVKGRYANQLVLGYGGLSEGQIAEGIRRLNAAIDAIRQGGEGRTGEGRKQ